MSTTLDTVRALPVGKSFGFRRRDVYALICHRPLEGLVVECGWVVPETYDDDPSSYGYNPFRDRLDTPAWVGRRYVCSSAVEAAEVYAGYKTAIHSRQIPCRGEPIGSVQR